MAKKHRKIDKTVRGRDLLQKEAKKDLKIDPLELDKNCMEQADLYLKYSERLNVVDNKLLRTEHALTAFKAGAYLKAKSDAANSLTKVSEAQASSMYRIQARYKVLKVRQERVQAERDSLQTVVNAFIQRRAMLETMVKLHGQDYFQG
jgi:stress response protein YsnF